MFTQSLNFKVRVSVHPLPQDVGAVTVPIKGHLGPKKHSQADALAPFLDPITDR